MTGPRSIWRAAARILLAYQALIAAAVMAFGAWIGSAAAACQPDCGVVGAFLGLLGFVWVSQALGAGAAVVVFFGLSTVLASLGAGVGALVASGVLVLPATRVPH